MSLSKAKIKYIHSLKEKKFREEYGVFVAEGDKMVSELLVSMECELLAATDDYLDSAPIDKFNIKETIEASKAEIEKASFQKSPQQVLAVFRKPVRGLDTSSLSQQLSIALDGIQDPGNLGTIIRMADWYGIENIICSEDTVDAYNPKVVQATMGALARVKIHYVNLYEWLRSLEGIPTYGTFLSGTDIYQTDISPNGIIIMGNEGNGIRPEIEQLVTSKLYIPSYPKERNTSESLNVAVATAIICSEFRRRIL